MNRALLSVVSIFFLAVPLGCTPQAANSNIRSASASSASAPTANPEPKEIKKPKVEAVQTASTNETGSGPVLESPQADGMNWLTPEEIADGWIRLFDGHTLFGWKTNNERLNWSVKNGVITAETADAANAGLLVSTTRFANYELRCDVHVERGGTAAFFCGRRRIRKTLESIVTN